MPYGQDDRSMDPEMLGWLLEAYGGQLEGGEIDDKLVQARALRSMGMEQPGGRQAGRVYVAQSPFETIGATMMGVKGIRDEKQLMKDRRKLNKAQGDRAATYGGLVLGGEERPQYGPRRPSEFDPV